MMTRHNKPEAGPISSDTLRNSDLIIRFWETLEDLNYDDMANLQSEAQDIYAMAHDNPDSLNYRPDYVNVDDSESGIDESGIDSSSNQSWYESATWLLFERLFPALEDIASEHGLTFSASDGDGACFGFWEPTECVECFRENSTLVDGLCPDCANFTDEELQDWLNDPHSLETYGYTYEDMVRVDARIIQLIAERMVRGSRPHSGVMPFYYRGDRDLGYTAGFLISYAEVNQDYYEQARFELVRDEMVRKFPALASVETFGGFGPVFHLIVDLLDESGNVTEAGRYGIELLRDTWWDNDCLHDRVWDLEYEAAEEYIRDYVRDWNSDSESEVLNMLSELGPFSMAGNYPDEYEAFIGMVQDAAEEWHGLNGTDDKAGLE